MKTRLTSRNRSLLSKAILDIEFLEPRAYLAGVVFQTPGVSTNVTTAGIAPTFATLSDLNADSQADLVVANSGSNTVSVLLSNGDGTFHTPATSIAVGTSPLPLVVQDVTGDGNLDIVSGNTGTVSIVPGNGNGTFGAATNVTGLTHNDAIAVGDFNGDGRQDIVVTNKSSGAAANDRVGILFQNSDGSFTLAPLGGITHTGLDAVAAADLNGDGHPDIAIVDQNDNKVTVIMNNGNGTFAAPVDYNTGSGPTSIVAADFNGDLHIDLVTADSTGGAVSFLANSGTGTFPAAPVNSAVAGTSASGGPLKVRQTNINGDNVNDLIVLDGSGSTADATVLLGNAGSGGLGNGTFHTGTLIGNGQAFRSDRSIATGDLNNDTLTDAVVADPTAVTAFLNVTNQDTTPPTATVPGGQSTGTSGATTYQFTVTYTDNTQVDAATIGDTNLTVTGPNGFNQLPTLVSQNLGNAASVTATYQLTFAAGLAPTDNGSYLVNANGDGAGTVAVKDAKGNPVTPGQIGTLTINVAAQVQQPIVITSLVKKHITLKAGKGKTFSFSKYLFPNANGNFFMQVTVASQNGVALTVAGVTTKSPAAVVGGSKGKSVKFTVTNTSGVLDSKDTLTFTLIANPTAGTDTTATAINIAPAFVDLANQWNGVLPATFPVAGKKVTLVVPVLNNGNVTAKGTVDATITLSTGGVAGTPIVVPVKVSLPVGKVKKIHVKFTVPALTTGAAYSATLTISPVLGFIDSNSANDTVASVNTATAS